jgi:hypothetical protein
LGSAETEPVAALQFGDDEGAGMMTENLTPKKAESTWRGALGCGFFVLLIALGNLYRVGTPLFAWRNQWMWMIFVAMVVVAFFSRKTDNPREREINQLQMGAWVSTLTSSWLAYHTATLLIRVSNDEVAYPLWFYLLNWSLLAACLVWVIATWIRTVKKLKSYA